MTPQESPTPPSPIAVLFVCMGNICRSPTAHGVFLHMVQKRKLHSRIRVDSAGTHNYHPQCPPDARSQEHAALRGYDLSGLRARQIRHADLETFDWVLVMDWDNLERTQALCQPHQRAKVRRLTEFCQRLRADTVPDPYYGGAAGFEEVLDLVEDACTGFLSHLGFA